MKILLTGAGGFLGKQIVEQLLKAGESDLRLGVRQAKGAAELREIYAKYPTAKVQIETANLLDKRATLQALDGIDTVVHAAAGTKGGAADMFLNSVVGTRNLIEAMLEKGTKRFVFVSSFSVYDTYVMNAGATLDENSPLEVDGVTKGAYAYTKVQQENLVKQMLQASSIDVIFVRPGVIYGPGGSEMSSRVGISALGFFAKLGGANLLPLTHVTNCAAAIVSATQHGKANDVFNVIDDNLPSCREYLSLYRQKVRKMKCLPLPYPALLMASKWLESYSKRSKGQLPAVLTPYVVKSMYRPLKYSNARLKSIGWSPQISIEKGLEDTFKYFVTQKK
jgi:nucleoside-diphosphate-sugar epimerase